MLIRKKPWDPCAFYISDNPNSTTFRYQTSIHLFQQLNKAIQVLQFITEEKV